MSTAVAKIYGYQVALRAEKHLRQQVFIPPPKLTVSEWADRNRMLTSVASAEPGRWRTDRAPYQRGIMDAFSDPMIERVVVMSSAQVGKTEIVLNVIGYFMEQDPSPMLVLQPTLDMARVFSKDRLREMIQATPCLQALVGEASGRREADDTILSRRFPGGHISMVGANSPSSLASRPIRVLLNDEVDRFPPSAGREGDPVSLGRKRTTTFWNRKEGDFSTPTVLGASRIAAEFAEGDQRRYHVPCPHCLHMQHLRFGQLDFEAVAYVCEGCGVLIEERYKLSMLAKGEWVAEKPGGKIASFHINALYSPWTPWADMIAEFRDAKKSPEKLQVFINTMLGELWDPQDGEGIKTDALASRRETYLAEVPAGVGVLTAAIDVQGDRLELQVKGYGAGHESWLIAHHRIYGDPATADVWKAADLLLTKPYAHELGASLNISACCIDSGDGQTVQHVYTFVRSRQRRGVYATKGSSIRGKPIVNRPGRPNKYGVKVFPIGTDTAKDVVFARLRVAEPGPGYMHFPLAQPDGADEAYLQQFGAEKAFIRRVKGVAVREYRQIRDRNEAIDLEVLCLAALHTLGAGVYDQLAAWVERVQQEGAALRRPTQSAPAIVGVNVPRVMPHRPKGYVNSWRR